MKSSLITFLFIFLTTISFSQAVEIGGKAGGNLSSITSAGDDDYKTENQDYVLNFHAGAFANWQVNEKISLGLEVLYSKQGTKNTRDDITIGDIITRVEEQQFQVDYLNVPVLMEYTPSNVLTIYSGIQPGFVLNAKQRISTRDFDDIEYNLQTEDGVYQFGVVKEFDLSLPIGFTYQTEENVQFDLRYNHGLTSVFEQMDDSSINTGRNSVFQVGINYTIFN